METRKIVFVSLLLALIVSSLAPSVIAQEEDGNFEVFGLELEKLIALVNGWLALFLFVMAFIAYKRDKRKGLFYVSLAFLLFSIKSFLIASVLFFPEVEVFDPISVVLEFAVLLSFFYGVVRK